jgi:hypothetical protein
LTAAIDPTWLWKMEDKVIVEVKASERLAPLHEAQLRFYLRVSGKSVGLIINFPVRLLKNGLQRIVNEFPRLGALGGEYKSGE